MGSKPDLVADGLFRVGAKIGAGSFGDIYIGANTHDGSYVGIKLESRKTSMPQLQVEARLYRMLEGGTGVPRLVWLGTEGDYNIMVIDLLGPSLEALFLHCRKKLSLKTTLLLADQIITRIESVHEKHFLHRDIKPDNFLMGLGKRANIVNVIDFGLAKKFRDPATLIHIPFRENKQLTGTARYASINTHLGMEQSRRDDLESIGYMLVYFMQGHLPWMGIKDPNRLTKYQKIGELKMATTIENLCTGLPSEFIQYFNYTRALEFDEEPDYNYLRSLFRQRMIADKIQWDWIYDWTIMKYEAAKLEAGRQAAAAQAEGRPPSLLRPSPPAARKSARAI